MVFAIGWGPLSNCYVTLFLTPLFLVGVLRYDSLLLGSRHPPVGQPLHG